MLHISDLKAQLVPKPLRAFLFERKGKRWVVCWHTEGEGTLSVDIPDLQVRDQLYEAPIALSADGTFPLSGRRYLTTDLSAEEVRTAFAQAKILDA